MIGWFDCGAGASGDMFLGSLVDAGVPITVLREAVDALDIEPVTLTATPTTRHGLAATRVNVEVPPTSHDRRFTTIRDLITRAPLPQPVRDTAVAVFAILGRAEAAAHGVDIEEVHFHEVGALDSLTDVVAACAGAHWLREHRGVARFTASQVTVGGGVTRGAHGAIPLPAPATVAVLSEAGAPVSGEVDYEACTPTGAALLAVLADSFNPLPPMTVDVVGAGAGGRDPEARANLLRLVLGTPVAASAADEAVLLEANVDDLDPRCWPAVLEELAAAGASDAWLTPIVMKKGRSAHTVHALCPPGAAEAVRRAMFVHTSTIGLRATAIAKHTLRREFGEVTVDDQRVAVKIAHHADRVVNVSVEYEDVVAAARATGSPIKTTLARANAAAAHRYASD